MNTPPRISTSASLKLFKTILYILAVIVLIAGLLAGLSLMTSASRMVANMLLPLQLMGGSSATDMISPMFSGIFINTGLAVLLVSLVLSALLYAVARLIGHILRLDERVLHLENRS